MFKNYKFFFISFFLIISYISTYAKPITVKDAEQIVLAKLLQSSKYDHSIYKNEIIKNEKGLILFYAVHLNPVGFIIVPGDDRLNAVIAYSFIDKIDPEGKFFDFLTDDIQKRFDALDKIPFSIISDRQKQRQYLINLIFDKKTFQQWPPEGTTTTGGWLETNWHQSAPYNQMCPVDITNGNRSVAGCPAVAMAMIINYHKTINNTVFTDADDYYHNYAGRQFWIDDDYEGFGFPCFPDLNKYLDSLVMHYGIKKDISDNDKAALTFACGVAARQVYTSSISGTFGVSQAYEAYLKFACNSIDLLDENDEDLYDRLSQNMKDSLPAHLAVVDAAGTVGHNVVVDGYNTNKYYHVNFGWGGTYNAWYILPDELPYNLTVIEGVILDIMKPEPVNINIQNEYAVNLYPNPANDYFSIFPISEKIYSVCIYNLQGSLISQIINIQENKTNISHIPDGTYIVEIEYRTGQTLNKKLVVIK